MKIEFDLPDLKDIYVDTYNYSSEGVCIDDIKKAIMDEAISQFINHLYDNWFDENARDSIKDMAREFTKKHEEEIIEKITNRVSEEIISKKQIKENMPKKSEINAINKEWENYFIELIDKAIAKKFK